MAVRNVAGEVDAKPKGGSRAKLKHNLRGSALQEQSVNEQQERNEDMRQTGDKVVYSYTGSGVEDVNASKRSTAAWPTIGPEP
jgi:hypothetical protein